MFIILWDRQTDVRHLYLSLIVFLYSHMHVLWFIFMLCMYYCFIHCYYSVACTFDMCFSLNTQYSILNLPFGFGTDDRSESDRSEGCRRKTAAAAADDAEKLICRWSWKQTSHSCIDQSDTVTGTRPRGTVCR